MLVLVQVRQHVVHPRILIVVIAALVALVTVKLQVPLAYLDRLAVPGALRVKPLNRLRHKLEHLG